MKKGIYSFVLVLVVIILTTACSSDTTNKNKSNLSDKERVEVVDEKVTLSEYGSKELSNLKCGYEGKKVNYTLKLDSGDITIINEDNFENYSLKNIGAVKTMASITYSSKCEDTVYILLTVTGDIYYSNSDIVLVKSVKDLDKEFIKLSSNYKFSDLNIGDDKELYSNTFTSELVKLNFR